MWQIGQFLDIKFGLPTLDEALCIARTNLWTIEAYAYSKFWLSLDEYIYNIKILIVYAQICTYNRKLYFPIWMHFQ